MIERRTTFDETALRVAVGSVWLLTGVSVVHPHFRMIGAAYLGRLGWPVALMPVACAAEIALGLYVVARPFGGALAALQVALVLAFTAVLATLDPMLLVHPFGALTKNVPLLAAIGALWLVGREGWSGRAMWLLRAGIASVWITEGLLPKVLFQQEIELAVVRQSGLVPGDPAVFLLALGIVEALSGVLVLVLRGRALVVLLRVQAGALVVLPLLVGLQLPLLWVHPFGPLIKNIPILVGTLVLARVLSRRR